MTEDNRVEEALQLIEQFQTLQRSTGWKSLEKQLDDQIKLRYNEVVLKPLDSINDATRVEFMKGEIAGLRLALELPAKIIEGARGTLDLLNVDTGDESDSEGGSDSEVFRLGRYRR